jgi:hypothetical protein
LPAFGFFVLSLPLKKYMTPLFKKLNFNNHKAIVCLNAPDSFTAELAAMQPVPAHNTLAKVKEIDFVLVFATKQAEVDKAAAGIGKKLAPDAVVWFCYPKGTSKKYKCEFNRDNGWSSLAAVDMEPVRMVAIDEDWSALRFRQVNYIKTMTRSFAMTKTGKEKVAATKKAAKK